MRIHLRRWNASVGGRGTNAWQLSRTRSNLVLALLHIAQLLGLKSMNPNQVWTTIRNGETTLEPLSHGAKRGALAHQQWNRFLSTARANGRLKKQWEILHPSGGTIPRLLRPAPYLWRTQAYSVRLRLRAGHGPIQMHRQKHLPPEERKCVHCNLPDTLVHHYVHCQKAVRVDISVRSTREFFLALLGDSNSPLLHQVEPCLLEHP